MHEETPQSSHTKLKTKLHYPPTIHLGENRWDNDFIEHWLMNKSCNTSGRRMKETPEHISARILGTQCG